MGKIKKQAEIDKVMGKDDDLKIPKHDGIMIWLNKAIDIFLPKWINIKREWNKRDFVAVSQSGEDISFYDGLPIKPNIKIIRKKCPPHNKRPKRNTCCHSRHGCQVSSTHAAK